MKKREIFRKSVAWSLITTLLNPAMIAPAFARDSDIYLNVTSGSVSGEPNVLLVIGTNDRMNIPDPWKEYDPDFYDSHTEYLWNDRTILFSNFASPQDKESPNSISTIAQPKDPFSPWGTWDGGTDVERTDLWKAVKAYAEGVQPGDLGKRVFYRNYWNGSWLYWLPAGSNPDTDKRLWSTSFNRFQAHIQTVPGKRGNVTYPATNVPYDAANGSTTDFRKFNLCSGSIAQLTPSTIFAPTDAPPNAGYFLNQQWVRYEPYLGLTPVNIANYPGDNTNPPANQSTLPPKDTFFRGYVDGVGGIPPARDDWPRPDVTNVPGLNSVGRQGQPIRTQGAGYAGWTDPKADLGGFVFQTYTAMTIATNYFYAQPVVPSMLLALRGVYGYSSGLTEQFAAWRGNRDNTAPAPAFGMAVGTPAYYDITVPPLNCDPTNGPPVPNMCIQFGGANITQACALSGTPDQEVDATNTTRLINTGGIVCQPSGAPACTLNGATVPCAALPATITTPPLTCAPLATENTFYTKAVDAIGCTLVPDGNEKVDRCLWSGDRQSVLIEGQGTYYYGGTCSESGVGTSSSSPNANSSCQVGGGSWITSQSLNGITRTDVTGPFASPVTDEQKAQGCSNKPALPPGSILPYGSSCGGQQYTKTDLIRPGTRTLFGPPNDCTAQVPSGGTTMSIRGGPTRTYNQICATPAPTDGTCSGRLGYGGPCIARTSACVDATRGTGNFYQAYKQQVNQKNLYHECLADGPTLNPGAGGSYPTATAFPRTFDSAAPFVGAFPPPVWDSNGKLTNPWIPTATGDATANPTFAYTTNAAEGVTADPAKNIDVYSVNYLNWKYGAKACRDSTGTLIKATIDAVPAGATCKPIGRKTRLQIAKDALSGLVANTNGVRLGLMVYNQPDGSRNVDGGNIAYAIRRMGSNPTDMPAVNNRADLIKAIQGVVAVSRTPLTETMYEAYRYFSGRSPKWGTSTAAALSGIGTVTAGREMTKGNNTDPPSVAGNVFLTNAGGTYNSPMLNNPTVAEPAACQKNYIVMITNGQPEDDFSGNADIKTMAWETPAKTMVSPRTDIDSHGARPSNAGPPDYQQIPAFAGGAPYGSKDSADPTGIYDGGFIWLDELTYFMGNADVSPGAKNNLSDDLPDDKIPGRQSVVTYTIGFKGLDAPVIENAAKAASGLFYPVDNARQLQSALIAAFIAIRNWNPTAAAATVPISSLNRGESSTDVYLAFFGPGPQSVWPGTVKKYQISTKEADCGTGVPLCLTGQGKIASTGLKNIESTDPITGQSIVDPTASSGLNSDGTAWMPAIEQDGANPNKGGTGYVLVNQGGSYTPENRKLYTFLSGGASADPALAATVNRMHFNNSAITKARLGDAGMSTSQQETLINYIRGGNLGDTKCTDGTGATTCDTWNAWPHFGTEHSKPAIVTYDASTAPPVQYLYYLQNNGMLTAVDANSGKEKWSFLIEEALPQLSAMQANLNGPEIYVADGNPEIFFDDSYKSDGSLGANGKVDPGDRVWLYFGLRRGGRVVYAIDITQRDAPVFKWKISAEGGTGKVCNGTSTCTTVPAFNELGQTWSTPLVAKIKKFPNVGDPPALIFGGGYDADAEDTVPAEANKARSMGRAFYVVNGDTAAIVQAWGAGSGKAGAYRTGGAITKFSIPSDATIFSSTFDQFIDRVYVGDMGGNVWRFDIGDANEGNWKGLQLASLSDASGEKRKFFFAPAVAPQFEPFGVDYDAVYIGSGDKEHPTLTNLSTPAATAEDRMFMLMVDPAGAGTPGAKNAAAIPLDSPITLSTLLNIPDGTTTVQPTDLIGKQGWMHRLENGEKVVNSPTVFFGKLRFGTYAALADNTACAPPGQGRLNEIDSLTGSLSSTVTSVSGAGMRYYSGFISRGYMSSTQLLVLRTGTSGTTKTVFTFTCADANCSGQNVMTLGAPTKIYWYMEPEQ